MTVWLVKVLHMAAIALWVGALVALPSVLLRRGTLTGNPLHRLHRAARFLHVAVASPAAYVAIGSGVALVFLRATWTPWFALKLLFVGALVVVHIALGLVLVSTFEPDGRLRRAMSAALRGTCLVAAVGILWAVLAKPEIDAAALAGPAFEPGALGAWFGEAVAPVIDEATP